MTLNTELKGLRERTNQTAPLEWLIASGQEVTEAGIEAAKAAQRYENRERIPEGLLWMADLYNELTGQEPTKRVLSDWILTFEEWRGEKLEADEIRAAWNYASGDRGFPVGRPGALTSTAVAMRSKSKKSPSLAIDTKAIEATKRLIKEKDDNISKAVPRPANVAPPKFSKHYQEWLRSQNEQ